MSRIGFWLAQRDRTNSRINVPAVSRKCSKDKLETPQNYIFCWSFFFWKFLISFLFRQKSIKNVGCLVKTPTSITSGLFPSDPPNKVRTDGMNFANCNFQDGALQKQLFKPGMFVKIRVDEHVASHLFYFVVWIAFPRSRSPNTLFR